eukprot:gene14115-28958_t
MDPQLSPIQSKRAAKREAKRAAWKAKKVERQQKVAAAQAVANAAEGALPVSKRKKKPHQKTIWKQQARKRARQTLEVGSSAAYHVAFDVSFCSTMRSGELNSMVRQIRTCHDNNLLLPAPDASASAAADADAAAAAVVAIHVCGLTNATEQAFAKIPIWDSWTATKHAESVAEVFAREKTRFGPASVCIDIANTWIA